MALHTSNPLNHHQPYAQKQDEEEEVVIDHHHCQQLIPLHPLVNPLPSPPSHSIIPPLAAEPSLNPLSSQLWPLSDHYLLAAAPSTPLHYSPLIFFPNMANPSVMSLVPPPPDLYNTLYKPFHHIHGADEAPSFSLATANGLINNHRNYPAPAAAEPARSGNIMQIKPGDDQGEEEDAQQYAASELDLTQAAFCPVEQACSSPSGCASDPKALDHHHIPLPSAGQDYKSGTVMPFEDSLLLSSSTTITLKSSKDKTSKRKKAQAKRVVCVQAKGGTDKPVGECVPADSWAWRKYGQKPIKGSPYPRGYYRCSSAKGCTARKQVERSRSDPTMLVITYTSDHNHANRTTRRSMSMVNNNNNTNLGKPCNSPHSNPDNDIENPSSSHASSPQLTPSSKDDQLVEERSKSVELSDTNYYTDHATITNQTVSMDFLKLDQIAGYVNSLDSIISSDMMLMGKRQDQQDHYFSHLEEPPSFSCSSGSGIANLGSKNELLDEMLMMTKSDHEDEDQLLTASQASVDPFNLFNWSSSCIGGFNSRSFW